MTLWEMAIVMLVLGFAYYRVLIRASESTTPGPDPIKPFPEGPFARMDHRVNHTASQIAQQRQAERLFAHQQQARNTSLFEAQARQAQAFAQQRTTRAMNDAINRDRPPPAKNLTTDQRVAKARDVTPKTKEI